MVHRVAVLALDPVVGYDMSIPPQIFAEATDKDGETPVRDTYLRAGSLTCSSEVGLHDGAGP